MENDVTIGDKPNKINKLRVFRLIIMTYQRLQPQFVGWLTAQIGVWAR